MQISCHFFRAKASGFVLVKKEAFNRQIVIGQHNIWLDNIKTFGYK